MAGRCVPVGGLLDGEEVTVFVGVRVRSRLFGGGRSLFAHALMIPRLVPRLAGYPQANRSLYCREARDRSVSLW